MAEIISPNPDNATKIAATSEICKGACKPQHWEYGNYESPNTVKYGLQSRFSISFPLGAYSYLHDCSPQTLTNQSPKSEGIAKKIES